MYKILIVEDDETIARLLGEHLEKWGRCGLWLMEPAQQALRLESC